MDEVNKVIEETVEVKKKATPKKKIAKTGFVSGTSKLRVRREPSLESAVIVIIDEGTPVKVYGTVAGNFYRITVKICGIEHQGHCLKEYISVKGE